MIMIRSSEYSEAAPILRTACNKRVLLFPEVVTRWQRESLQSRVEIQDDVTVSLRKMTSLQSGPKHLLKKPTFSPFDVEI